MRGIVLALSALALTACNEQGLERDAETQGEAAPPAAAGDIEAAMADSAAGWNEGDMERFLAIYSADPQTSFVGANGLTRGMADVEARYRESYDWSDPDPSERGVLTFETLDFRPLGPDHALYIGQYTLTYPDGREPATGPTSLVFAREAGGWKIIADHSS